MNNPAPLVRARAAQLGDRLPESSVIPPLLVRLEDSVPVVRLSAHEELRRRTGQDFGYHPWDDAAQRAESVRRWRLWWAQRQGGLARTPAKP
jgi:hypothetical protein